MHPIATCSSFAEAFFANRGDGDYGKKIETTKGIANHDRKSNKAYFSIFGKITISRYLYHIDQETFSPLDIILNLPIRCYSYFLSEMMNLLNIKGAYSEGVNFIKKFFRIQVSVAASETISYENSSCYEEYYELRETLKKPDESDEKKDYTAVSFDGKGVPMIKKEGAKIVGRQGKGQKKQKKKECLVGVKHNIDTNNIASYIMELQAEMLSDKWKKESHQEKFKKVITYLKNHKQYMKYDEYLSNGYPIGAGIVESACGHVVKDRMEISGARWSIHGSEPILRLRSVVKSKNWDEYWEFFTSQARENILSADDYNPLNIQQKIAV